MEKILILAVLAFLLLPNVMAEESTLSAETETELGIIVNPIGAELRFLQLERAVTNNILTGSKVVEVIQANHPDANATGLNSILGEMEILLEEIKNEPRDGNVSEVALRFVELKNDSISLTKQFREEAAAQITVQDREQIREQAREIRSQTLDDLKEKAEEARREWNANRIETILQHMGVVDANILAQIREEGLSLGEVKARIRTRFNEMNEERKQEALQKVKEAAEKLRERTMERIENVKEKFNERVTEKAVERKEERKEKLRQRTEIETETGFEAREERISGLANSNEERERNQERTNQETEGGSE